MQTVSTIGFDIAKSVFQVHGVGSRWHEHILALVEAIHGADLDAVHGFAANAALT